jgi:hypothetical protein
MQDKELYQQILGLPCAKTRSRKQSDKMTNGFDRAGCQTDRMGRRAAGRSRQRVRALRSLALPALRKPPHTAKLETFPKGTFLMAHDKQRHYPLSPGCERGVDMPGIGQDQ